MGQQAEHSETFGIPEADPRHDDEAAQVVSAPTPTIEAEVSIFPDPFGEKEGVEPVPAPRESADSTAHSDIADDSIVECMRESECPPDAEPASRGRDQGSSLFGLDGEGAEQPTFLDASAGNDSDEDGSRKSPAVSSGCGESVRSADPTDIAAGHSSPAATDFVGSAPRTVSPGTGEALDGADPRGVVRDPTSSGELTSAAHVVGSALEEIVSNLIGSVLQSVASAQSVSGEVIDLAEKARTAPPDDDHSYQFHAFQDDGDTVPVGLWGEEETPATPVQLATAVVSAPRETASGKSNKPVASSPQSHHVVPSGPADAPDGMLDYESSADPENADNLVPAGPIHGGGWTIPLLCAGISIIACCLLIPICDANRRAAYEKLRLRRDLEALQHQVATNDEFLRKVSDDPTLAERLAQRQLRKVRAGMHDVPLKDGRTTAGFGSMSPFGIVAVPPPPPLAPYQPVGGRIATMCYNPHSRLYLMGAGLMLLAMGLVMGYGPGIGLLGMGRGKGEQEDVKREDVKT